MLIELSPNTAHIYASLNEIFWLYPLVTMLILGLLSSIVGPMIIYNQSSSTSHSVTHILLPGLVLGYVANQLLHHTNDTTALSVCTLLLVSIGSTYAVGLPILHRMQTHSDLPKDASSTMVLIGFLGLSVVLVSKIPGVRLDPESLLLGDVLQVTQWHCILMVLLLCIVSCVFIPFATPWKTWLADPTWAELIGLPTKRMSWVFHIVLTSVVALGSLTMGNLLVGSVLILPNIVKSPHVFWGWKSAMGTTFVLLCLFGMAFWCNTPVSSTIAIGILCLGVLRTYSPIFNIKLDT
jgi:ABC-type Mn2+/Zn2+ transport system permease subunit